MEPQRMISLACFPTTVRLPQHSSLHIARCKPTRRNTHCSWCPVRIDHYITWFLSRLVGHHSVAGTDSAVNRRALPENSTSLYHTWLAAELAVRGLARFVNARAALISFQYISSSALKQSMMSLRKLCFATCSGIVFYIYRDIKKPCR